MGWFSKKKEKVPERKSSTLPELPKLPEFPEIEGEDMGLKKTFHQLPSFPSSSLGEKFSQNTIKEAITGKEEGEKGVYESEGFDSEEKMQSPLKKPLIKETLSPDEEIETFPLRKKFEEAPEEFRETTSRIKKVEPIFIRIDKFEESLKIFEKTKAQISEIEKMLRSIQTTREEEERELHFWEESMKKMKAEIEKVDQDIFSKIE